MNRLQSYILGKFKSWQLSAKVSDPVNPLAPRVVRKSVSQVRRDIAELKRARTLALAANEPRQYLLQDLFEDVADDARLTSQYANRREKTMQSSFELYTADNRVDQKATDELRSFTFMQDLFGYIIDSEAYGYSLVELSAPNNICLADLIPRRNISPLLGRFYPDISLDTHIDYRDINEYGRHLLEFNAGHLGWLNKAAPLALFKKFATSCWSELCEIYGIPPRYIKTDTRDPAMLDRAEAMMRDIGAAAWFIIDTTEDFQFATGVNTTGEVYGNLIKLCNDEISMLISGAIIGQDTKNGNESKEKVSKEITQSLIDADKRMVENYMNGTVLPALISIGWMSNTSSKFRFSAAEDKAELFDMTVKILPYKKVSDAFIKDNFGIEVEGDTAATTGSPGESLGFFGQAPKGGDLAF